MKLDESQINYSAMQEIKETLGNVFEYCDRQDDCDSMRIATLGMIGGIINLADRLKEVLKT